MKNKLNTILAFAIFCSLFSASLSAQISTSIVGPLNAASMSDEVAFLYQAQLEVPYSQLSQFIESPPVAISALVSCPPPEVKITAQDDQSITFRWLPYPGKRNTYWIRYLNMRTGKQGITSTTGISITLHLDNDPYIFMFQRSCEEFGSHEYIIIDDKPISIASGIATDCYCESSESIALANSFSGGLLHLWPSSENFVETYLVRINTYFGAGNTTGQPDMYTNFSIRAYGGNGQVHTIVYRNDCDENAAHDECAIFSIDEGNNDLESYSGNSSPAFLQFTFTDGIRVEPLGFYYNGIINVRKCTGSVLPQEGTALSSKLTPAPAPALAPQAFPNPSGGQFQLTYQLADPASIEVQVYAATGQLLKVLARENQTAGSHQLALDLAEFSPGAYYCRIQSAHQSEGIWLVKKE